MKSIVAKRTYQGFTMEVYNLDTIDVVRTSGNAAEISYKSWASGDTFDTPFSAD